MKALCTSLLAVLVAVLPITASSADTDRTLENVKGHVTYGASQTPSNALALHTRTALADSDYAATGADSLATITLPDSSQVVMASNSSVQMTSFAMTDIAHARFVVVGKVRFKVNHPQGAKADYQFQTTTGQIAVRGTEGDIFSGPQGLQVNVYAVSNPALPVQVTLVNGQVFTLAAGQSLVATAAAGAITASVTSVSQSLFTPFSQLGAPLNASSMGIATTTAAASTAAVTTAAAAAVGTAAAVTTIANSNKGSTPAPTNSPTPSPAPSTTSVPITVSSSHRNTATPAPPRPMATPFVPNNGPPDPIRGHDGGIPRPHPSPHG